MKTPPEQPVLKCDGATLNTSEWNEARGLIEEFLFAVKQDRFPVALIKQAAKRLKCQ